ncbi:DUF882 domain-containing protein [Microvirga roseola]|uniref:DUF882 domain-containing protein n=1 Tax=Microvirga roseola TaxID=2883126 RepID=UPI001E5D9437|nr:DUF882 domain-containing protein [Microvirga roseola]
MALLLAATAGTQDAVANGETRSLSFFHTHTSESTTVTFRRNGQYDDQALKQLNWFLRDWRTNEPAKMDPRLFDIIWEVYRESGSRQPIHIISAYRSPQTNGALRRRSKGVAENSQHMQGKAMDIRLPDVDTGQLRAIAMKMQYGGVGYYPSSAFVHVDTGSVRAWPRMSQEQLARLFPDGKTLHLPSNGRPLPGYEQAKAEIMTRNASLATQASAGGGSIGGIVAKLFSRGAPAQQMNPEAEAPKVLAYAAPAEELERVPILPPLPPRRPEDLRMEAESPLPPAPVQTSVAAPASKQVASMPQPVLWLDQKAAVKALFDPRSASLGSFAAQLQEELSTERFTGPAVKPVPAVEQAQVAL